MKKISKKAKIFLRIILCIIILTVISIFVYLNIKDNINTKNASILFESSYQNYAWKYQSYGYYIYSNGYIKEYDDYDNNKKLKSAKISEEELAQLKELAKTVEDKYEKSTIPGTRDGGTFTKRIYNENLSKWVILSKFGDSMGNNPTETSEEILKLTDQLYEKYLKED